MRFLMLVTVAAIGCGGDETELTACEGAGAPALRLGDGGREDFVAWDDGHPVDIVSSGAWGFRVELEADGFDTTSTVNVLFRHTAAGDTETSDAAATVTFLCEGEGPAWAGLFVPLDDPYQTEAAARALDGEPLHVTVSAVDAAEDAATVERDLVLAFP